MLLTPADCPKAMPPGVGGFFNPQNNTLFCAERPASKLLQASVVLHEFTHGLHGADQTARQQEHPIWIKEGLLKAFYDEYTQASNYAGDKSAQEAIEVVFGKPVSEVERDWKAWVLKQTISVIPFLGVMTEEKDQRLVVKAVVPQNPAAIAGIRKGDVIVSLEGAPIQTKDDLMEAVENWKWGRSHRDVTFCKIVRAFRTYDSL